jgi:sulfatase modifying factor 1
MIKITKKPENFPYEWASDWGQDPYGLWTSFTYKKVKQTLRWIQSGNFKMGSPESEPERDDDELLHKVILTKGFWMADTACTQALWEAVMGKNPSRFKGPNRPVENVSWDDCQQFFKRINKNKPGLDLRLPTEAEWEYACRAGTTTPFSFGNSITPDLVNYDGNYPYAGGKKGKYREETVAVKSLPGNQWGLYEMHGNVYEWCADWYGKYTNEPVTDPIGPPNSDSRVLRGGCWILNGGRVRSAYRFRDEPDYRDSDTGFRFA